MTTKLITLTQIAKQARVNAKIARRRLRTSTSTPAPVNAARWAWQQRDVAKVRSIIKAV